MESIPRISRAQSMDALSSQANVAGYKAVLLAAEKSTRFFPMLTTAAGTVKPATVLVLGVGVAGLQALATAKRLGARTTGYDVRPEVADQVRSLGAQWLDLGHRGGRRGRLRPRAHRGRAGRAAEAARGGDHRLRRGDHHRATCRAARRPTLVTAEAVEGMRPGSVVVDLAGESGGNCELTEPGEIVVKHDVTIASPLNLPATMPEHASELYARNVSALLELMLDDDGALRRTWTTRCSPSPASPVSRPRRRVEERLMESGAAGEHRDPGAGRVRRLRGDLEGAEHPAHSADVGHQRDPRDRAARWADRAGHLENPSVVDQIILVIAIVFGMINVVGGFLVTDRMLGMFKAKPEARRTPSTEKAATDGKATDGRRSSRCSTSSRSRCSSTA